MEYLFIVYDVWCVRVVESADEELNKFLSFMQIFEAINYLGSLGWILVSTLPNNEFSMYGILSFKRQIV
jgi:hypothetical protein